MGGESSGVVIDLERIHDDAHARASVVRERQAQREAARARPEAEEEVVVPFPSVETKVEEVEVVEPGIDKNAGTSGHKPGGPNTRSAQMQQTFSEKAKAVTRRGLSFTYQAAGFLARRMVDMAPGAGVGVAVAKFTRVPLKTAVAVGAMLSQAGAIGRNWLLRDATSLPEAKAARSAIDAIREQAKRGRLEGDIKADMVAAGWPADIADSLYAAAVAGLRVVDKKQREAQG